MKIDKEIIVNQGKEKYSYNQCFAEIFPIACSFANKFLDDLEIAKDLVQDTFIIIWDRVESFESKKHIKSYLYKSLRNSILNHLKRNNVINKYIENRINHLKSDSTFLDNVIEQETHLIIYNAIEQLPENQKKVIYLSLVGLSNEEIAAEMDISLNTAKTHKARAYKQLKNSLGNIYSILLILLK